MKRAICYFFVILSSALVAQGINEMFTAKTNNQIMFGLLIATWNIWNLNMWCISLRKELKNV